ncbi:AAA family ATPase [Myxococcota bacterium]|nr:AAA family ATPase [Myxococcota bacterium]
MSLLDKRIVLVTGKGGVGKTTVTAALGVAAAASGRRALIAEVGGARRVHALFGAPESTYKVAPLTKNLYSLSITADEAIEDYILQQIRVRALFQLVFRNRVMGPFLDAVPGLHDLVQLGKVFDLSRQTRRGSPEWDLLIIDAPATGHGLTMLASPLSMMELTGRGPFYENARLVHDVFMDPARTGLALVSLPEEMPVNETLDLYARLGPYQRQVQLVALNELHPEPFGPLELWEQARGALSGAPGVDEALRLTDRAVARARRQRDARTRLTGLGDAPLRELPFLFRRELREADLLPLGRRLLGEPA